MPAPPVCLAISGSDSSGGAGMQADLKTFFALGVYGTSALTAITAQNTTGVQGVLMIDPAFVVQQAESVFSDFPVAAVKVGMLGTAPIIEAVADLLRDRKARDPRLKIVVDPVMVARSGDTLLEPAAIACLRDRLLPMADLVTPNRREASLLTGIGPITDLDRLRKASDRLFRMIDGPAVLVKGGEAIPGAVDLLIDGLGEEYPLSRPGAPLDTRSTHGTGCTLSAAIAALLSRGKTLRDACAEAKEYVFGAIEHAPGLGSGHGPIEHGWMR